MSCCHGDSIIGTLGKDVDHISWPCRMASEYSLLRRERCCAGVYRQRFQGSCSCREGCQRRKPPCTWTASTSRRCSRSPGTGPCPSPLAALCRCCTPLCSPAASWIKVFAQWASSSYIEIVLSVVASLAILKGKCLIPYTIALIAFRCLGTTS